MSLIGKSLIFAAIVVTFVTFAFISGLDVLSADEGEPAFTQDPVLDLRAVSVVITTESDGQFELVIGNPTLNEHEMAGEIKLVVPPGMSIYGSILGGSGGTGMVLVPFDRDPIKPGSTRTSTLFVKSQVVGKAKITADLTVWPVGNKKGYKQAKLHYEADVTEPSSMNGEQEEEPSGGCSIGGKPDASLALFMLILPATAYLGYRRRK